jgi:hypothetical protein
MRCHGLVHAKLLVLVGRNQAKVRFVDREGRSLHAAGKCLPASVLTRLHRSHIQEHISESIQEALGDSIGHALSRRLAAQLSPQGTTAPQGDSQGEGPRKPRFLSTSQELSTGVDVSWWRKTQHLFEPKENGHFKFVPGFAVESSRMIYRVLDGLNQPAQRSKTQRSKPVTETAPWAVRIGHPKTAIDRHRAAPSLGKHESTAARAGPMAP